MKESLHEVLFCMGSVIPWKSSQLQRATARRNLRFSTSLGRASGQEHSCGLLGQADAGVPARLQVAQAQPQRHVPKLPLSSPPPAQWTPPPAGNSPRRRGPVRATTRVAAGFRAGLGVRTTSLRGGDPGSWSRSTPSGQRWSRGWAGCSSIS